MSDLYQTSKPKMLLCVLGGVVSYEDYGSFRTSRLGKAYYDAAKDNDCDILIIDPLTGDCRSQIPEAGENTVRFIKESIEKNSNPHAVINVTLIRESAELFDYDLIFKNSEYSDGGVCIINDIKGTDDSYFKELREKVYDKLSEYIHVSTVPISLCEIFNDYGKIKMSMFWSKKKGIIELNKSEIEKEIRLNIFRSIISINDIGNIKFIWSHISLNNVHREKTNIILSN